MAYLGFLHCCLDGIVGEVLFWVMKQVLGKELYTAEVHLAWVKLYNRMLQIIMPVAVSLELHPPATTFLTSSTNDRYMLGNMGTTSQKNSEYSGSMRVGSSDDVDKTIPLNNPTTAGSALKSEQLRSAEEMPATYFTTPTVSTSTSRQSSGEVTLNTHRIVWSTT
jgi:hypothetical protein